VTGLAVLFFGFNLWGFGFALGAFFANLVLTSWSVSLVVNGLILRHGLGAEGLAWSVTFIMLPLCAVYYPVAVLPGWLQTIAWMLPPTYVFEGMRALVLEQTFRSDLMITALAINAVLLAIAATIFLMLLKQARVAGTLLQTGE
jgi:ABC-2 type transport system permease protein